MTRETSKTEGEAEAMKTTETEQIDTIKEQSEGTVKISFSLPRRLIKLSVSGNEENADLGEVRKLIQAYMKEELRKIENTTEEHDAQQSQMDKQRRIKSGNSRISKPRTPK